MTPRNSLATLAEYHAFATARGQTTSTSATDDGVIELLLDAASDYIHNETQRHFLPFVQTRYYDTPTDTRELSLDEDLLEVISLLNGDNTSVPSTEYNLVPRNFTPHYGIRITDISSYTWTSNVYGSFEDAVSVLGVWGFHDKYSGAWKTGSATAEALDDSETEIDVTSEALFSAGQIVRVENELMLVTSTATGKINVERGYNGSTAAAHNTAASVTIFQPMMSAKHAALEIVMHAYKRRFGQSQSSTETITAAGVVLTPRDIPSSAAAFIAVYRERA